MAYNAETAALHDVSVKQLLTVVLALKAKIAEAVDGLPKELFLDQAKTVFVPSFTFKDETYPGATNPSLDGKPVMVLAVKGVDNASPADTTKQTITYSFLDMSTLVDTYKTKSGITSQAFTIAGYEFEVHLDPSADNHLSVTPNGFMVDVSDKADKVTGAVAGNIATLDANGNLVDSGRTFATDAEITEMLAEAFPTA